MLVGWRIRMAAIALNRRFVEWAPDKGSNPDLEEHFSASREALTWDDLLAKHRVVILAEAGSGKSTELEEQARLSRQSGRWTFECTLQSLFNRRAPWRIWQGKRRQSPEVERIDRTCVVLL